MPTHSERSKQRRTKALEHLEAAPACLDETADGTIYFVECAIDEVTSQLRPVLDPPHTVADLAEARHCP